MDTLQTIISIIAAILAIACPLYTLLMRERSLPNGVLLIALAATAALEMFELMAMIHPAQMEYWKSFSLIAESCLPASWILYSLLFARPGIRSSSYPQRFFLIAALALPIVPAVMPLSSLIYSPDFSSERTLFLSRSGFSFYLALTVGLTIALINLEATFAHCSGLKRWSIKFEILGTGTLLAGLFVYYGHSFLYRTISMNLAFIKSIVLLLAASLIGYSQFRSLGRVRIHVSRNLAYKSMVLLVVGTYLICLGLLGEGMQYFDQSFVRLLAITTAVTASTGLLVVLFSESLKRKIQLFLSSHFYQNKYDYRTQWLQFTDSLSSARSVNELSEGIITGYCETFGMVCGAVFIRKDALNGYVLSAQHDLEDPVPFLSHGDPFARSLSEGRELVILHKSPFPNESVCSHMLKESRIVFAIPICSTDAMNGFIILGRPLDRLETYTFEDYDLMNTIAHQAAAALLNLTLSEQLAQVREVEVLDRISAFMIHDLKNHVHTLSLMADNAKQYISDPDFQQDMLISLENTTLRMKTLISKFKEMPRNLLLHLEPVELFHLASQVASGISGPEIQVRGYSVKALVDGEQFRKVLINLVLNAVDATQGKGPVMMEVGAQNARAYVRVLDEGCGIPEDFFRQHLFSPFKTSKTAGLGIGLFQSKQIVEAHNGRIEAVSEVGKGSAFTVWLPLVQGD